MIRAWEGDVRVLWDPTGGCVQFWPEVVGGGVPECVAFELALRDVAGTPAARGEISTVVKILKKPSLSKHTTHRWN